MSPLSPLGTNLQVIGPRRVKVEAGDLFALSVDGEQYLFGQVISTEAHLLVMTDVIYIYLYQGSEPRPEIEVEAVQERRLLVPPIFTNRLPWTKGLFLRAGKGPVDRRDHGAVFLHHPSGKHFTADGDEVSADGAAAVGVYGLDSFRTIDDSVSRALGIPVAPRSRKEGRDGDL